MVAAVRTVGCVTGERNPFHQLRWKAIHDRRAHQITEIKYILHIEIELSMSARDRCTRFVSGALFYDEACKAITTATAQTTRAFV